MLYHWERLYDVRRRQQELLRDIANERRAMAVESNARTRKGWIGRLFGLRLVAVA